jgi:uncharacterized protein YjiS (DUF1127 family)
MFYLNRDIYRFILKPSSLLLHRGECRQSALRVLAPVRGVGTGGTALPRENQPEKKMSTMSQAAARPAISLNSGGSLRRFGIWAHALVAYLDRRAAVKTLRQMDDRELRDIGLIRSHIEDAVRGIAETDCGRLR